MKQYEHLAELETMVGQTLGISDWITVDQDRINLFADATGDHQWIHTDPERSADGPFGKTIAHGFLTLSLLPMFTQSAFHIKDVKMGLNYGLNRVRFTNPVPVGSRLRGHHKLIKFETIAGGAQLTLEVTVEIEGVDKPACVAESLGRRFT